MDHEDSRPLIALVILTTLVLMGSFSGCLSEEFHPTNRTDAKAIATGTRLKTKTTGTIIDPIRRDAVAKATGSSTKAGK